MLYKYTFQLLQPLQADLLFYKNKRSTLQASYFKDIITDAQMSSESFCNWQKGPRGPCVIIHFVSQQQTPIRKKAVLSGQVIRGLQQWSWLTASAVQLFYKTRLFFEQLSSSRTLSSQSEFLFAWELAHHSWSPTLKDLVSLLWLSTPSSWSHFFLLVEVSVLAAGESHCMWGVWLFRVTPCCLMGHGSWGLPGQPGAPEGGTAPECWGLKGCGSLKLIPWASKAKPILHSSLGSWSPTGPAWYQLYLLQ